MCVCDVFSYSYCDRASGILSGFLPLMKLRWNRYNWDVSLLTDATVSQICIFQSTIQNEAQIELQLLFASFPV